MWDQIEAICGYLALDPWLQRGFKSQKLREIVVKALKKQKILVENSNYFVNGLNKAIQNSSDVI